MQRPTEKLVILWKDYRGKELRRQPFTGTYKKAQRLAINGLRNIPRAATYNILISEPIVDTD